MFLILKKFIFFLFVSMLFVFLSASYFQGNLDKPGKILVKIHKKIIVISLNLDLNENLKYRIYEHYLSDPYIGNISYILAKNSLIQYLII